MADVFRTDIRALFPTQHYLMPLALSIRLVVHFPRCCQIEVLLYSQFAEFYHKWMSNFAKCIFCITEM